MRRCIQSFPFVGKFPIFFPWLSCFREDENLPQTAQLVSAEPDVSVVERDPATDQFICLACDGIYDVFSNVDLADYINAQMSIKSELDQIATEVVDTSLHKVPYF